MAGETYDYGLLADPEKLKQLLAQFGPTAEDKAAAKSQALMSAGLALMGARKGSEFNAAAQAGLLGLRGYNEGLDQARQNKLAAFKMQQEGLDYLSKQQQFADEQAARKIVIDSSKPPVGNVLGMTPEANAANAAKPKPSLYEQLLATGQALQQQGLTKQAALYFAEAQKLAPKYKGLEPVMDPTTKQPVLLQTYENQAPTPTKYLPKPDFKQVDTGGSVGFVDPFLSINGPSFNKTMTPGEKDASARGWAGLRQADEHFNTTQATKGVITPKDANEMVGAIRKEYSSLDPVKNFRAAVPMLASAKQAPDTPAGDLDVIYAVGKALDPNSVVREGELDLVIKSGSPVQFLQGYANKIKGGGRLPPSQRAQLMSMLEGRVSQLKQAHDSVSAPFIKQAQAAGLPLDQIFSEEPKASGLTPAEQQELDALRKRFGR